jgi:hypothetical protein
MTRLYVPISDKEYEALRRLAYAEKRRPQDQASFLLGQALAIKPSESEADSAAPSRESTLWPGRSPREADLAPA